MSKNKFCDIDLLVMFERLINYLSGFCNLGELLIDGS